MPLTTESALRKDRKSAKSGMEHRHFATIADIIRQMPESDTRGRIAIFFADELRSTNPRFDRARFLRACGVEG